MSARAEVLMAMSYEAAEAGNMELAEFLMDQAENLIVEAIWKGEAN